MAYDKVVDSSVLDAGLKQIADAIREKGGTSDNLAFPQAMADAIAAIEAGGGDVKFGVITPAENTQTLTIEHGYGSTDYNFYAISATDTVGAYSQSISFAAAKSINATQACASVQFEYKGSTKGEVMTSASNMLGHLDALGITEPNKKNMLELSTALGKYPLNSSYPDVVFKGGMTYAWLVAKI